MEEIWQVDPDYSHYEWSSHGRVRSSHRGGKILKQPTGSTCLACKRWNNLRYKAKVRRNLILPFRRNEHGRVDNPSPSHHTDGR